MWQILESDGSVSGEKTPYPPSEIGDGKRVCYEFKINERNGNRALQGKILTVKSAKAELILDEQLTRSVWTVRAWGSVIDDVYEVAKQAATLINS